jgi:hypothetical protein
MTMSYNPFADRSEEERRQRAAQLFQEKADSGTFTLREMHQLAAEAANPNAIPPPPQEEGARGTIAKALQAPAAQTPKAPAPKARKKTLEEELADLMGSLKGDSRAPAQAAAERQQKAVPAVNDVYRGQGKSSYSPTGRDLMEGEKLLRSASALKESPTATVIRDQDTSGTAAAFANQPKEEENPYLKALARLKGGL